MAEKNDIVSSVSRSIELASDAEIVRLRAELAGCRGKYKAAIIQLEAERAKFVGLSGLSGIATKKLDTGSKKSKRHEATIVIALSDWHVEERVDPDTVNGLNDYSLDVADARIQELAERIATLVEHERSLVSVRRIVLWLGGDFISGHIHDDTAELAQLAPLAACRWAGERIKGLVDLVAGMADEVIVATNSGNHGRSTDKLRIGTEMEHSFEQSLYLTLAGAETRKNVRWQVGGGYLNIVEIDGFRIRFHHGHAVQYGGGSGGITIPVNKAIASWDRIQTADLTVFGHWHQFQWLRASKYVANGSLIGHSAYATRIKASYEPPCQAMIVIDHGRREVTRAMPIFCDRDLQKKKTS